MDDIEDSTLARHGLATLVRRPSGAVAIFEKAKKDYAKGAARDTISIERWMEYWCDGRDLLPERFKVLRRKGEVRLDEFKAYQLRAYGFSVTIADKKLFIVNRRRCEEAEQGESGCARPGRASRPGIESEDWDMTRMTDIDLDAIRTEEHFVTDTQLLLHEMMLAKGITRAELARRMGVSRARVTQIFSSECTNFTVRLLARAMHALGEAPAVACEWTRQRDQVAQHKTVAALIAGSAGRIRWMPDGVVVPPDDGRGDCLPDRRVKAVLRARRRVAREDHEMREAA